MAQLLRPDDPRFTWQGVVSLQRTNEWVVPWRIPFEDRVLFPPDQLRERAAMPAGVRISFRSDTTTVVGMLADRHPEGPGSRIDICCDRTLKGSVDLAGRKSFRFIGLPSRDKLIELWLPLWGRFRLRSLELGDGAAISPFNDSRPRWIVYGSSLTHCRRAASPTQSWPAIVARERDLNLTCLGYGGECHLDTMIARTIRDLPADLVTLSLGINVYNHSSLSPRTFRSAIIGFVKIIREKHPGAPLLVISPSYSALREDTPNVVGFTLRVMREEVAAAVQALQSSGDRRIEYVDGLEVLGPESKHLIPDGLHPNADGIKAMGRAYLRVVDRVLL